MAFGLNGVIGLHVLRLVEGGIKLKPELVPIQHRQMVAMIAEKMTQKHKFAMKTHVLPLVINSSCTGILFRK
jgi:hypothetical protein